MSRTNLSPAEIAAIRRATDWEVIKAVVGMTDSQLSLLALMGLQVECSESMVRMGRGYSWISFTGSPSTALLVWGYAGSQYWEGMEAGCLALSHDGALHCMADAIAAVGTDTRLVDRYLATVYEAITTGEREVYP